MILDNIDFKSYKDYIYMERYINSGSPSGFTDKYNTSPLTRPSSNNYSYSLCSIKLQKNIKIKDYGEKPSFFTWDMLIHPDFIDDNLFLKFKKKIKMLF